MTTASETGESELQEITGPSALGGGARRFFDLLWLTAVTEFKLGYHGTALGFLWSFARPLILFSVLLVVFTQIFRFGDEVEHYAPMLLLNILLFSFFAETTEIASGSVLRNENIVRKMQFPRLVIPLAVVLTRMMQLGLSLIIVVVFLLAAGVQPVWTWLLFPFALLALLVFTTALALLLSALYVRIRDIGIIWSVSITVLLYATPVIYPIDFAKEQGGIVADLIMLNPLSPIFEQTREWVIQPTAPGAVEAADGRWFLLAVPAALYLLVCVLGVWIFNREAPRVAEEL